MDSGTRGHATAAVEPSSTPPSLNAQTRRIERGWVKVHLATLRTALPHGVLATLAWMCNHVRLVRWRSHRPVDSVYPGAIRVAEGRGIHERTARKHLQTLVRLGLLELVTEGGRGIVTAGPGRRRARRFAYGTGSRMGVPLANTYSVTARGWACAEGRPMPEDWLDRLPADGRRKRLGKQDVATPPPGHNAIPGTTRKGLDLGVVVTPGAAAQTRAPAMPGPCQAHTLAAPRPENGNRAYGERPHASPNAHNRAERRDVVRGVAECLRIVARARTASQTPPARPPLSVLVASIPPRVESAVDRARRLAGMPAAAPPPEPAAPTPAAPPRERAPGLDAFRARRDAARAACPVDGPWMSCGCAAHRALRGDA